jgi:hypothetical protein
VGARIPAFEAHDQNGARQTFDTIKERAGAVLLFHRCGRLVTVLQSPARRAGTES